MHKNDVPSTNVTIGRLNLNFNTLTLFVTREFTASSNIEQYCYLLGSSKSLLFRPVFICYLGYYNFKKFFLNTFTATFVYPSSFMGSNVPNGVKEFYVIPPSIRTELGRPNTLKKFFHIIIMFKLLILLYLDNHSTHC